MNMLKALSMGVAMTRALKLSSLDAQSYVDPSQAQCEAPQISNGQECVANPCWGGSFDDNGQCVCPDNGFLDFYQCRGECPGTLTTDMYDGKMRC